MNALVYKSITFVKKNSPTILTCVGAVGVVATAVTAAKSTPKALYLLEQAEEEKGEELTKFEKVTVAAPAYIPSVLIGASTIACIFGANIINQRQQAALMSAYALLDQSYKEYRSKVLELYGEDANKHVMAEMSKDKYEEEKIEVDDDKELFFDYYSLRYFESTLADVYKAEYQLNQMLIKYGFVSLGEFYELLGIEATASTYQVGWTVEGGGLFYGYSWVDFEHDECDVDDNLTCTVISFAHDPEPGFNTW